MKDIDSLLLPEINLETDDIIKRVFINDLKAFIEEFSQTDESLEFMAYYD
ncbi:hypothetical protein [uncultured Methanobrevibacter sp.]|nr:hypothetical protein [uncultured Methanobrevibacter sp.]